MANKIFVIKTFQNNEVPASFGQVKIYIIGQDIVIKTDQGDIFEYPFAAQFLSMSNSVFYLKFADGKVIASKDLMNYVDQNDFDIDGSLTTQKPQDSDETQSEATKEHNDSNSDTETEAKEITETIVVKVEPVVVEKASASTATSSTDSKLTTSETTQTDVAKFELDSPPEPIKVISSSSAPLKNDLEPVKPNPEAPIEKFRLSTLQLANDIDPTTHHARVGGSRTDGSFASQYGRQHLDLSGEKGNWSVNAELNGWNYEKGLALRIVSVGDVDQLNSVNFKGKVSAEYRLILAGTPEGNKLGLKPNEFAVVYPAKNGDFSVDITFNNRLGADGLKTDNGETSGSLDFKQVENPSSITNDDGSINLGYSPNAMTIKLGSGDDNLMAGRGNDFYDGGAGHNTLDYSKSTEKLTLDLTKDVSSELASAGIKSDAAGQVTLGNNTIQYINNFKTIIGSDHDDTFILNDRGYTIYGGKGDDNFIMHGGNNTLDGGEGYNTLDYSSAGVDTVYNSLSIKGRTDNLEIDGVSIDATQNKTTHNGWVDENQQAGQDQFKNISEIHGSSKNDHIILGTKDTKIIEKSGDNYIVSNTGNHTIEGGSGNSIVDYSKLDKSIKLDLNTGIVDKGQQGQDKLSNILHVIGSSGGTSFIGKSGGHNTLVGIDGYNSFKVEYGYNALYGGKGVNSYQIERSNSTIYGDGTENSATVTDSILQFYGSAGQGAGDTNASYINNLDFYGGAITYKAGDGYSTNNIVSHNGGILKYYAQGSSSVVIKNGGDNSIFLKSGDLTFDAQNGGNNTLNADQKTELTIKGGQASHNIHLAKGSHLTLDYSKELGNGHNLAIDLEKDRKVSIDDDLYVDRLTGDGLVKQLNGLKCGNTDITLSQRLQEDMKINLYGENNHVVVGKGLVDISVDKASQTNQFDYSQVNARLDFDLSAKDGNLKRSDVNTEQTFSAESLKNVSYIIGNNTDGNTYKATDKYDVTFETGQGTGNKIIETNGNHTYHTQGKQLTYDASELTHGIRFDYTGNSGKVTKGSGSSQSVSSLNGTSNSGLKNQATNAKQITEVIGTDHDDYFVIDIDQTMLDPNNQEVLTITTGKGNNTVTLKNFGLVDVNQKGALQHKPQGAYNTLNLDYRNMDGENLNVAGHVLQFGENGQTGSVTFNHDLGDVFNPTLGEYLSTDFNKTNFNYIDHINFTAQNRLLADWGTKAQGVSIKVNNGQYHAELLVNGGGNVIDAGYSYAGSQDKISFVSYKNTATGIIFDSSTNIVEFADGRTQDQLTNFNRLQGSNHDDSITLHAGLELVASDGNDQLTGNGATYRVADKYTQIKADFASQIEKYAGDKKLGTDKLIGDGFARFINGKYTEYAELHSSKVRDMYFELNSGKVDLYSYQSVNNTINTGSAQLTLHYENSANSINLNMSNKQGNNVIKDNGNHKDEFTLAKEIYGTQKGDEFNFSGSFNSGEKLAVYSGQGVDKYTFNDSVTDITINARQNSNINNGETFSFNGNNSNITINSENKGNVFNLASASIDNTHITTLGKSSFTFNNTNVTNTRQDNNQITINSSVNEVNKLDFEQVVNRIDFVLNGGSNRLNFTDATTSSLNFKADSKSSNTLTATNSQLDNVNFTSTSGQDKFNFNNVNTQTNQDGLKINVNSGNNINDSSTDTDKNSFTFKGDNNLITINSGNKNDSFDFSNSKTNKNININDTGGDNQFTLSGNFSHSKIQSTGLGNDTFDFNNVNKVNSSENNLSILSVGGNNKFNFEGVNQNININAGSGDDTFTFSGKNSSVLINAGAGNDTFYCKNSNSLPTKIDGGQGIDSLIFNGQVSNGFDVANCIKNTNSIEKFDFKQADINRPMNLDLAKIKDKFNNDSNGVINITVGDKNDINISNGSSNDWSVTHHDGWDSYINQELGNTINIHYDQSTLAA